MVMDARLPPAVAAAALAVVGPVATLAMTLVTGRGSRQFLLDWDDGVNYHSHDLLRRCERSCERQRASGGGGDGGGGGGVIGGVVDAAAAAWGIKGGTVLGVFEPVALGVKCGW